MRQGEISLAGILALFSLYLMWKSAELPIGYLRGQGPGGGFWPFWLSVGMLLSCGAIAWNWWRGKSPASVSDEPLMDAFGWLTVLHVGGGVVGFVARHSWLLTLGLAVFVPVLLFFFFEGAMQISMPQGLPFTQPFFDMMYDIIY